MARRQNRHPPHPFNWNFSEKSTSGAAETASLAIFAEQKSHEMTDIKGRISPNTVSHFNRASNHNAITISGLFHATVSHFNRASNHNRSRRVGENFATVSHFNRASNHNRTVRHQLHLLTVSHFNRASNHNLCPRRNFRGLTVSHFNRASNHNTVIGSPFFLSLFLISIEHQITTAYGVDTVWPHCFSFQ